MNNRKRDILYMFIATVPLSAVLAAILIICEQGAKLYTALLPQLGMCGIIGIMLMQEKYIEKQNEIYRNRLDAEMRQQVIENYESDGYRNINASQKSVTAQASWSKIKRIFPHSWSCGTKITLIISM
ncbi:MAG: hypothetical protein K6B38_06435 [Ruminococcus sp.]|nr:hypothetical protein [Ruminococcus sp.]